MIPSSRSRCHAGLSRLQLPFSHTSDGGVCHPLRSVNSDFLGYVWCTCGGGVEEQVIPDNSTLSTGEGFIFFK